MHSQSLPVCLPLLLLSTPLRNQPGDLCSYAHGEAELRKPPTKFSEALARFGSREYADGPARESSQRPAKRPAEAKAKRVSSLPPMRMPGDEPQEAPAPAKQLPVKAKLPAKAPPAVGRLMEAAAKAGFVGLAPPPLRPPPPFRPAPRVASRERAPQRPFASGPVPQAAVPGARSVAPLPPPAKPPALAKPPPLPVDESDAESEVVLYGNFRWV